MPIIIDEVTGNTEDPRSAGLHVAHLEIRIVALESAVQDLTNYCRELEAACRDAFAHCPGLSPFPQFPGG